MTRLEAIRYLRNGKALQKVYSPDWDGCQIEFEIAVQYDKYCNYERTRQEGHERIGPIHVRFWSGDRTYWLHINLKQLMGWIKRTYLRH